MREWAGGGGSGEYGSFANCCMSGRAGTEWCARARACVCVCVCVLCCVVYRYLLFAR